MASSDAAKALLFCALLALQFGLQPLATSRFTNKGVSRSSIVFATEVEKIIIAIITFIFSPSAVKEKVLESFTVVSSLSFVALPALLYTVQNIMVQYSYTFIDSMTFNILNQTKTIWAAVWLYLLLQQKQSYTQVFALGLLLLAAVILNTDFNTIQSASLAGGDNYQLGVFLVLCASATSGLSAALTQRALKYRESVIFSAEMAVYSLIILIINQTFDTKGSGSIVNMFHDWDIPTLIPVTTNAFGGIIIGFVTKYAGGVRKGFALILGILVTAFAQWVIEGKPLRLQDWLSLGLVCFAIYLHAMFPLAKAKAVASKDAPKATAVANQAKVDDGGEEEVSRRKKKTKKED